MTVKILSDTKINNVNPLGLIIDEINGCIEKSIGNEYSALALTDGSKDKLKKWGGLWNEFRDLIRSVTNNLDNYCE